MVQRKRILLLLKRSMLDLFGARECSSNMYEPAFASLMLSHPKVTGNLPDRHKTHAHTVEVCRLALARRAHIQWMWIMRDELNTVIKDVDLVVTVGGDGTLLHASHFLGSSVPVVGVNSDPTKKEEVEENLEQFDATRSTGHLCAATADNFEQVLDEILDGARVPVQLNRIRTRVNGADFPACALNDVLLAHPNPAAVTRCSFSVRCNHLGVMSPVVHSRSSGVRVCTAAGATAAMCSAGGYPMNLLSTDLQYMVREPISPHTKFQDYMKGWVRSKEVLKVRWGSRQGVIYFDGSHISYPLTFGTEVEVSADAATLKMFVPTRALSNSN